MMAAIMALNALAIDTMLPALPQMARELGAQGANAQQHVISLYFAGLALGSLVHGPLADRYGRKRVIMACLVGYVVAGLASGLATSWAMLLTTRFIHGLFGAAMGVVSQAIIRDRTSGDAMAKLMSMIFLIFMIVPIIAPTIGQGVLLVADWRISGTAPDGATVELAGSTADVARRGSDGWRFAIDNPFGTA